MWVYLETFIDVIETVQNSLVYKLVWSVLNIIPSTDSMETRLLQIPIKVSA